MALLLEQCTTQDFTAQRNRLAAAIREYVVFLRKLSGKSDIAFYVRQLGRKECVIFQDGDGKVVQILRTNDFVSEES